MPSQDCLPAQRRLASTGAWLLAAGMLTGIPVAAALTHRIAANAESLLAAHLNALLGAFWIFAVAWSLPMLSWGEVGRRRLAQLVVLAAWANWFITLVKAFLNVRGLEPSGEWTNVAVALALDALVVLPSLAGAFAWAWGLRGRGEPRA